MGEKTTTKRILKQLGLPKSCLNQELFETKISAQNEVSCGYMV